MEQLKVTGLNAIPTSNDIEMVIEAFKTGNRQNFQHETFFDNISSVLGR